MQPTDREPRKIRETAGVSQLRVANLANVSIPLVRLFEASFGKGVVDTRKSAALKAVYADLDHATRPA